jgi:hypothetical protein
MQRAKSFIRRIGLAAVAAGTLTIVGSAGYLDAQTGQDYQPQATLVEVMDSMVMPLAQKVWDAVVYEETIKGPATDEGWQDVRRAAVSLAETANVLMIPGRSIAGPDKTAGEGELSSAEIQALIEKNHDAWIGFSRGLHEIATQAIHAVDTRDVEELSDVSGNLDSVCEGCHQQFWYPNQAR